jgi:signal transduction histidine kinase
MTFRTRILLACLVAAILPLILLAGGARHVVRERLTSQFRERVTASSDLVRRGLAFHAATIDARTRTIASRLLNEPDTRAALLDPAQRAALIDVAADAMATAGLDHLLLLDDDGTVLSSGHFRNDYHRSLPSFADRLLRAGGPVLVASRRATGGFIALVRARAFEFGGRRFTLAGGIEVDSAFVARLAGGWSDVLVVTLVYPGGATASTAADVSTAAIVERVSLPFIDSDAADDALDEAHWTISHSLVPLDAVVRDMDRWFIAALAGALLLAFVTAGLAAARVTRPLEQLARSAGRVELDRYDAVLATRRQDEIGSLSRLLDRMVQRLRASARQLRETERRATVGDMARQVNHDIRNGLLPIRNVIRHLAEVAQESPADLGTVFHERAGTLEGGIGYLENLAANYARITPRTERQPCDVNALLEGLARDAAVPGDTRIGLELSRSLPHASADPVALRRIVENLVINALESLGESAGRVIITTATAGSADDARVVITIADTGVGIPADTVERIFDDFYTTKDRGTGLGLSIVRRLVTDMGGRIRVESAPGRGTTFTIDLPAVS